jgi:hypothetical protein
MDGYLKLQLQQAIETYRWQYSLMIQIGTLLMVADAAVIWNALTGPRCMLWSTWLVGAFFPAAAIVVALVTAPLMKPVMYTAVAIEQAQRTSTVAPYDGLASMLISTTYRRQNYIKELECVAKGKDLNTRRAGLHELHPPYDCTFIWKTWTGWALLQVLLFQVFAALSVGPGMFKLTCLKISLAVFFVLEFFVTLLVLKAQT